MKKYDYLIVGAGLFGAVFAHEATRCGKTCLVIDRRDHIGGNIYTEEVEGIQVHRYGAHIFHTSRKHVWEYINQFTEFNHFINSPIAIYKDELYNMPFNMNTFHQLWGVKTPAEAQAKVQEQIARMHITHPRNLEEQALALVGQDVYEKLERATQENSGEENVKTFRRLLSNVFLFDTHMTTITLRIHIRVFRKADIQESSKSFWKACRYA